MQGMVTEASFDDTITAFNKMRMEDAYDDVQYQTLFPDLSIQVQIGCIFSRSPFLALTDIAFYPHCSDCYCHAAMNHSLYQQQREGNKSKQLSGSAMLSYCLNV